MLAMWAGLASVSCYTSETTMCQYAINVMIELVCTILNAKLGSCVLSKLDTAY